MDIFSKKLGNMVIQLAGDVLCTESIAVEPEVNLFICLNSILSKLKYPKNKLSIGLVDFRYNKFFPILFI